MEKQTAAELIDEVLKLSNPLNVIIYKVLAVIPEANRVGFNSHMVPMMAGCEKRLSVSCDTFQN